METIQADVPICRRIRHTSRNGRQGSTLGGSAHWFGMGRIQITRVTNIARWTCNRCCPLFRARAQFSACKNPREVTPRSCGETRRSFNSATTLSFADTAAVVSILDLVISVDTSVAHLAGALGKPADIGVVRTGLALAAPARRQSVVSDRPAFSAVAFWRLERGYCECRARAVATCLPPVNKILTPWLIYELLSSFCGPRMVAERSQRKSIELQYRRYRSDVAAMGSRAFASVEMDDARIPQSCNDCFHQRRDRGCRRADVASVCARRLAARAVDVSKRPCL